MASPSSSPRLRFLNGNEEALLTLVAAVLMFSALRAGLNPPGGFTSLSTRPSQKPISPSPTSSSSSCSSTSASPPIESAKQSLIDAVAAILEGNSAVAAEIITRLQQVANGGGSSEQRLTAFMVSALMSRVNPIEHPYSKSELLGGEHRLSTQMLYEASPCFKLCFMAANLAVLDATSGKGFHRIHVVDFDIGEGRQYIGEGRQYPQTQLNSKNDVVYFI